nr:oligosaccharide flippase family protein [Kineosporia babensis]
MVSGAGWLTVGTLAVGGLNYGYALILTHLLPTDKYAQFAAAQALLLTAGTIAAASIPWVLAQQLAKNPDPATRAALTRMSLLGNGVQGLIAALVILAVAQSFADPQTSFTLAVCVFLIFASSTTAGWLQGRQRFGALAAVKVLEVVVKCIVGIGLVLATSTAAAALGAFGAGSAIVLLLGLYWLRAEILGPSTLALAKSLWRDALGVASVQGLVSALASLDVVLVAVLPLTSSAAASYQASMIVARVPLFLGTAVAMVALPLVAQAAADAAGRQFRDALRLYAIVAVPFAVMLATAPGALAYLVFPGEFGEIKEVLAWTAASGLMIGAVQLVITFYQGRGEYRIALTCQLVSGLIAVAAILTGFQLGGIVGLAIGAFVGTTFSVAVLMVCATRLWPGSVRLSKSAVVAAAVLVVALGLASQYPVVWIAACLGTGTWSVGRILALRASGEKEAE